ncbi:tRNA (adenosine(37)-N6)-threonylcarbamoyltransferase complex transferase subunit TsaD [Candidatus Collierbacteria bacterium RIFOXYA1_FULL_46_24]|uniref:tRNA N6-adenosine threonylcarbamoyltransferase n=2 Tax=Candidatus Collieribacteriota TaxID=1752725 RepID=A0A1F5F3F1_9BACT|nr:MAG: tRNA (adenosine(37)-N6)-threonylcarbamoyltransferase complex transferase subunit TsaD [Candidatus Collierbacteria bacterium RIFOXYA1_FULL_46_24]OGD74187.1 MAG: tRNA (adenosine(37)-N6)-threonylcarbamoyltransferase complex transferase subunit TsaD [Candidatus Collierbacteria bacterium RIFOXYA2_FULL_46_10]
MTKEPTILSIETSLDDTCAAVTCGRRVLSNVVSSQSSYHADWGGTVPDLAKRLHQKWLPQVVNLALKQAGTPQLDALAVTIGPGLAPALEQGIAYCQHLALNHKLPIIAVNHLEGHLLSSFAETRSGSRGLTKPIYPTLGFLISGGHTELVLMHQIGRYELLGETLDDAAGEAYDKVARLLMLGYPGGPLLSSLAQSGTPRYPLPEPMTARKDLNFSFSGLKAAARRYLEHEQPALTLQFTQDFAASFQQAVFKHLLTRFRRAIDLYSPRMILLGGGVVSNVALRALTRSVANESGLPVYFPSNKKLITDNAAMIGIVASYKFARQEFTDSAKLDRFPNLNFPKI